jgi:putative endonuclease
MKSHDYFVYILASESVTLYIGVTSNLEGRMWEHRNELVEGFTKKYGCKKLIFFEHTGDVYAAISREKELKSWNRGRKERLISASNPTWKELLPVEVRPDLGPPSHL